jgi:hypothetical protein
MVRAGPPAACLKIFLQSRRHGVWLPHADALPSRQSLLAAMWHGYMPRATPPLVARKLKQLGAHNAVFTFIARPDPGGSPRSAALAAAKRVHTWEFHPVPASGGGQGNGAKSNDGVANDEAWRKACSRAHMVLVAPCTSDALASN